MSKVGIAIVTFNRLDYLKICLHKISQQSHQNFDVLVINNNSKDGTKEFLKSQDILQIHLAENTGPAGGFNEAIKFLVEKKEYDFLWLMDDDVFPAKDCLKELLNAVEERKIVYPSVRNKQGRTLKVPAWAGLLIPTTVAEQAGLPIKELFYGVEDTEYIQYRIRQKLGCQLIWVTRAKAVHFTPTSKQRKPWVYYYEIRNLLYYRVHVQKGRRLIRIKQISITFGKLFLLSILSKNPENVFFFCKGLKDGLLGKIGKTVEP